MAAAPRSQLWVLDLLLGGGLTFTRSVSFHLRLVPAIEAKVAARRDVVRDLSDQVADQRPGRLADEDRGRGDRGATPPRGPRRPAPTTTGSSGSAT